MSYSISPNPAVINENGGTLTFTVARSDTSTATTIYASTLQNQGYSNTGNQYYNGLDNQAVSFAVGQSTAQVQISIHDLGLTTGSEKFGFIVQQNATDPVTTFLASDTFTILDNDPPPSTYSISPNPASVNENAGTLTFTVTRTNSAQAATVYASTLQNQGYSNSGNHYYDGLNSQAVNFAAGQSSAQVQVSIHDLGLTSGSEKFGFIVQQNASDPTTTFLANDTFTILDNDPTVSAYSISPSPASVNENTGTLTFTVTRTNATQASTVYASTVQNQGYSNPSNEYYSGLKNVVVNFAAGQSSAQVQVSIHDLGLTSGSEKFGLIVQQNASDPNSTFLAKDTFTIVNNDHQATGLPVIVPGGTVAVDGHFDAHPTWGSLGTAPAGHENDILTHTGVDIDAPTGTAIDAFGDGTVADVGHTAALGNYILIFNSGSSPTNSSVAGGQSFYTLYLHMENAAHTINGQLQDGDSITQGEMIGQVGSTGESTGPHVHFEIRLFSGLYNPFPEWWKFMQHPNIYAFGNVSVDQLYHNGQGYLNPENFINEAGVMPTGIPHATIADEASVDDVLGIGAHGGLFYRAVDHAVDFPHFSGLFHHAELF